MFIVSKLVSDAVTFTGMYDCEYVPFAGVGDVRFIVGIIVSTVAV